MSAGSLVAIFGGSFVISLTGALSPGPLTTLAVREGVRKGFWAGPALAAGHGIVELALVVALALGLDQLLDSDAIAAVIAFGGGGFLVWLGAQVVRHAPRQDLPAPRTAASGPEPGRVALSSSAAAGVVGAGMAASLSNPFWFAWWATVGAAYIAEALDEGAIGVATFYSAHILTDIGWLSVIALALATGRRIMSARVYRGILAVSGVFLLALGGWFLASGFGYVV